MLLLLCNSSITPPVVLVVAPPAHRGGWNPAAAEHEARLHKIVFGPVKPSFLDQFKASYKPPVSEELKVSPTPFVPYAKKPLARGFASAFSEVSILAQSAGAQASVSKPNVLVADDEGIPEEVWLLALDDFCGLM